MKRLTCSKTDQVPGVCLRFRQTIKSIIVICLMLPWDIVTFPILYLYTLPKAYKVLREYGAPRWLALKGAPLQTINLMYLELKRRI